MESKDKGMTKDELIRILNNRGYRGRAPEDTEVDSWVDEGVTMSIMHINKITKEEEDNE